MIRGSRPASCIKKPNSYKSKVYRTKPKVLVADEPTSALDVSIQAQVLNLFIDLQKEFNTAYVFISHNLAVVRHVADQVLVMYLGRPAEMGPKADIYEKPLHPYTQALLSATPASCPTRSTRRMGAHFTNAARMRRNGVVLKCRRFARLGPGKSPVTMPSSFFRSA